MNVLNIVTSMTPVETATWEKIRESAPDLGRRIEGVAVRAGGRS